jgi:hypothetical protein
MIELLIILLILKQILCKHVFATLFEYGLNCVLSPYTDIIILFWMKGLLLNIIFDMILKIMRCWSSVGSIATALQASGLEFWQG